jgi:hypothetical protein
MRYTPTDVAGVTIIDIEPHRDDGGFFSRAFCANEFAAYGLISNVAQTNISYNYARGTLRGLHRQMPPYPEAKLVRCTRHLYARQFRNHEASTDISAAPAGDQPGRPGTSPAASTRSSSSMAKKPTGRLVPMRPAGTVCGPTNSASTTARR